MYNITYKLNTKIKWTVINFIHYLKCTSVHKRIHQKTDYQNLVSFTVSSYFFRPPVLNLSNLLHRHLVSPDEVDDAGGVFYTFPSIESSDSINYIQDPASTVSAGIPFRFRFSTWGSVGQNSHFSALGRHYYLSLGRRSPRICVKMLEKTSV